MTEPNVQYDIRDWGYYGSRSGTIFENGVMVWRTSFSERDHVEFEPASSELESCLREWRHLTGTKKFQRRTRHGSYPMTKRQKRILADLPREIAMWRRHEAALPAWLEMNPLDADGICRRPREAK